MADMDAKYDSALMGILSNEGEISKFLDAVFGFLYRRTDYFRLLITKEDKIGFPPGVAAKILLKEFHKYEQRATKNQKEKIKPIASDVSVPKPTTVATKETPAAKEMPAPPLAAPQPPVPAPPHASSPGGGEGETTGSEASSGKSGEEDMDTLEARQQQEFQANPMSYNGAVRDKYAWSQSISDVDIRVFVPSHIKKGRQVSVGIEKKHLQLSYLDESGTSIPVLDDDLTWEVDKEECMWTLAPGEHVHINLEKKEERWWEGALASEPKINVRKIDCSRPMTDLDEEAQAKIGEMMYNEQQKRLGLPQSHEQKTHEMLRKAWDAEGSPFKGQPFDPSVLSVDKSGMVTMKDRGGS